MDIKFIKYLFIFWLICLSNYSYSQERTLSIKPTPTPEYIATYVNPTPTPTCGPGTDDINCNGIPNGSDPDVDGDGTPNGSDSDVDGDGIPNGSDSDVDGDGIPNGSDSDIDGDGLSNNQDLDMDGDGTPNINDSDADGDGVPDAIGGNSQAPGADRDDDSDGIDDEEDDTPKGGGSNVSGKFVNNAGDYSPWHEHLKFIFVSGSPVPAGWFDTVRLLRNNTDSNTVKADITSHGNNCYILSDKSTVSILNNDFTSDKVLSIKDTSSSQNSGLLKLYYGIQGDGKADILLDEMFFQSFPNKVNYTVGVYRISWYSNGVLKTPLKSLSYVVNAVETSYENKYWEPGSQVTFNVIESKDLTITASDHNFADNDLDMVNPLNPFLSLDEQAVNDVIYSNTSYNDSAIDIRIITMPGKMYVGGVDNSGQVKGNWAYIAFANEQYNTPPHEIAHIIAALGHDNVKEGSLMHGDPESALWYLIDTSWAFWAR